MIEKNINIGKISEIFYREFKSIFDFYKYISENDINKLYKGRTLMSVSEKEEFTGTKNFEEAVYLLKNGWKDMSIKVNKRLGKLENTSGIVSKKRQMYDVVGYQVSVPRYLQGLPTSMINSKNIPVRQKVITINKLISYPVTTNKEHIIEESVKMLSAVKRIEQSGVRCKINILMGSYDEYRGKKHYEIAKVCVKSPMERMNISKLSFVLVHPSMLRRLYLRYIEVSKTVTRGFKGYGYPISHRIFEVRMICKNEYLFPAEIGQDTDHIVSNIDTFFCINKYTG